MKDNCDSGQFLAIQKAAIAGLDDPEIPRAHSREVQAAAGEAGRHAHAAAAFKCEMPGGTYFLYTPSPKGLAGGDRKFENAEAASQYLITQQSICTVPWDDAGAFLRFSVTYEAADEAAEDCADGGDGGAAEEHRAGVLVASLSLRLRRSTATMPRWSEATASSKHADFDDFPASRGADEDVVDLLRRLGGGKGGRIGSALARFQVLRELGQDVAVGLGVEVAGEYGGRSLCRAARISSIFLTDAHPFVVVGPVVEVRGEE